MLFDLGLPYHTTSAGYICIVHNTAERIFRLGFSSWLVSVAAVTGVVAGFWVPLAVSCLHRAMLRYTINLFARTHSLWIDGVPAGLSIIYFAIPPARTSCRLHTRVQIPAGDQCQWG